MIFGYSRPKNRKEADEQKLILQEHRCDTIMMERIGEGKIQNSKLDKLIDQLRKGDQVIVASIYVFPMTLLKLIDFFSGLLAEGIEVYCIREEIKNLCRLINGLTT